MASNGHMGHVADLAHAGAASPEVARARGPLNSLHPLVSSDAGWRKQLSVCFLRELLFPVGLSMQLPIV